MAQWLVRTSENQILGPWSQKELVERILAGEFRLEDEVCGSGDYWIALHERDEVKEKLGIEAPIRRPQGTEEETQTDTERTDTSLPMPEPRRPSSIPLPVTSGEAPPHQPPVLALFLTLGGLGLVIFVVFLLRAALTSRGP